LRQERLIFLILPMHKLWRQLQLFLELPSHLLVILQVLHLFELKA
jgi:hypothetical protein